jgi:hypothetical protein
MEGFTTVTCRTELPSGNIIATSTADILNPLTFTLHILFRSAPYTQIGDSFNLRCDGVQNPKNLLPTSSWSLMTFDKHGCGIEKLNQNLIIEMFGIPSFVAINVTSDVPYNGEPSTLSLEFTPLIPFSDNYTIFIAFPREVRIPFPSVCLPHLLTSRAECETLPENKMKVRLTFIAPPANPYEVFGFKLDQMINQENTKPTGPFTDISAYNSLGQKVAFYTDLGPTLRNREPAPSTGTL